MNRSSWKTWTCLLCLVPTIFVVDLTIQGVNASGARELSRNILLSATEEFYDYCLCVIMEQSIIL